MNNPYEYYENKLGVQGRFLFSGKNAHERTLSLIGYRGFAQKIERGAITKLRDGGGLDTPMLVLFDSLPMKWQELIVKAWGNAPKLIRQSEFEKLYVRDMAAFDFYSTWRFDNDATLDDNKIDEYTLNASVLNTAELFRDKCYKMRKSLRGEVSSVWDAVANEVERYRLTSGHTLPKNANYLRRVFNKYNKEGYASLISGKHNNANRLKVDEQHASLLNDMFCGMDHKPTKTETAQMYEGFLKGDVEVINNATGEVYNPDDYVKLSERTIYDLLSKWENRIGNELARSGDRQKYMAKFKPYHKLLQPEYAGSIISIDDRQPVFEYADGKRMWFYNGIDLGSEAFVCNVWGRSKEGIIIDFYRQMVRNYAEWGLPLPAELEGEMSLNSGFLDTFLQEGNMFQYVRIEANNARGKRIEQYYRPLRYQYEKKRLGWLARPFALSEANQARTDKKMIIPYEEIVQGCLQDIQTWNNTEHSKIKGMSRWDVFLAMQNPNTRPTNYRGILRYLGMKETSSVHAGMINFRRSKFLLGLDGVICTGDRLVNMMMMAEGRDVDIYWLDDNMGGVLKAYVYMGNQFICEAIEQPSYHRAKIEQKKEDIVNRELMSKYVNTIESYGRSRKKELDKVTVIDNRPVTINNNFKIRGLETNTLSEERARVLNGFDEDGMQDIQDMNNTARRSFKKQLINNF